jgi:two-component system, NtrC family, nitrogen regulation response regulator GlnG
MRLTVSSGPDAGKSIDLVPGNHVVGKSSDCALVLTDPKVSRQHLELQVTADGIVVRDLKSRNGSFIHGARFDEVRVGAQGLVRIGDSMLRLCEAENEGDLVSAHNTCERMHGVSVKMRHVFALVDLLAPTDATILIQGETGTGKELCAEALHLRSHRKSGPFVVCDMAGMSQTLMESELFGHKKGAFTGAHADRRGAFEEAHGGTIFIDEIGELPLPQQPLLLRAIEQRQVKRVGATEYKKVDVRVIAATNRDLEAEVKAGRFREDLFHRLAVLRIFIPPLRERKEDIAELLRAMLADKGIAAPDTTIGILAEYAWPGNVRELRNVVERAVSMSAGHDTLEPRFLGFDAAPPSNWSDKDKDFFEAREKLLATWERTYLSEMLQKTHGNVSEAARRSGIDRVHLYRLLKKYGLKDE